MVSINGLYQSVQNFETGTRVKEALLDIDASRFAQVSVIAFCGIIELYGTVSHYYDKTLAIGIAERVFGVTTVVESIQIGKPRNSLSNQLERTAENRVFRSS